MAQGRGCIVGTESVAGGISTNRLNRGFSGMEMSDEWRVMRSIGPDAAPHSPSPDAAVAGEGNAATSEDGILRKKCALEVADEGAAVTYGPTDVKSLFVFCGADAKILCNYAILAFGPQRARSDAPVDVVKKFWVVRPPESRDSHRSRTDGTGVGKRKGARPDVTGLSGGIWIWWRYQAKCD